MNRGLWFFAGAGAGVYAVFRGRRAAEALSVDGLGDRLSGLALGARMFRDEVAQGRAEKQTELRGWRVGPAAGPGAGVAGGADARELALGTDHEEPYSSDKDRTDGHR